jgi:hypothetical protein
MSAMAGYSTTPLDRKIGIKPGHAVVLLHAPEKWAIEATATALGTADVVIGFYRDKASLVRDVRKLPGVLPKTAMWWVAWPRKAAGHVSDITENLLRELLLPTGLVDVKVAALDEDWSGLKFVWRKELR